MALPTSEQIARLPADGGPDCNRLVFEKSPYLRQHARNPVDWYPWGTEALERARREDKAIFLSVGYSTCHWCHVMERESFENAAIAKVLNENFVPIKVDREERPDIDDIYMKATQLMTRHGGWPNSVWLTPDGRPFFAGTYFPPDDRGGRPGFVTVLERLAALWRDQRADAEEQAARLTEAVERFSEVGPGGSGDQGRDPITRTLIERAVDELADSFDAQHGGFGTSPKFPPHGALRLLFHEAEKRGDERARGLALATLDGMAAGGVRDHVGGGFHRYSTDQEWLLPHFEKMLYDNAELARSYVDGWRLTGETRYRRVAEETLDWMLREMRDPEGGFFSALDADSEGEEGKFYVWTHAEIQDALKDAPGLGAKVVARFVKTYDIQPHGNFRDEATGEKSGANVPRLGADAHVSEEVWSEGDELRSARQRLLDVRVKRPWPHLDDKVLASWNGLAMGAFAYAGCHLDEPRYVEAAVACADFVDRALQGPRGLLRSYRDGSAHIDAYLDDYALVADGLLDLFLATGETRYRDRAAGFADEILASFRAEGVPGFAQTSVGHEQLIVRPADPYDHALPSGNGAVARVLVRLAENQKGPGEGTSLYLEEARQMLAHFAPVMRRAPRATESLILAAALCLDLGDMEGAPTGAEPTEKSRHRRRSDASRAAPHVQVDVFSDRLQVTPGSELTIDAVFAFEAGWHVAVAPTFRLEGRRMPFLIADVVARDGEGSNSEWRVRVTVRDDAQAGAYALPLCADVSVCSGGAPGSGGIGDGADVCLPSVSLDLSLPILIRARG